MLFLAVGAWPVFAFFGLDAFLVWAAFKLNYRSGQAFEEIEVWQHAVEFRQVSPSGRIRTHRLNPFWTRLRIDRHKEIGITRLTLSEKGRVLDIGNFLNPVDREGFASALGQALAKARS